VFRDVEHVHCLLDFDWLWLECRSAECWNAEHGECWTGLTLTLNHNITNSDPKPEL